MAEQQRSTREVILAEALPIFAAHGFEGTSLNAIAEAVGIRKPSVLHHFSSKDEIYRSLFRNAYEEFSARVEEAVEVPMQEGWSRVDHVLSACHEFFRDNDDFIRILRREAIEGGDRLGFNLGEALRPQFVRAVNYFEHEMGEGRFRKHDPEQLVLSGYGALLSYFSDRAFLEGLVDRDPLDAHSLEIRLDHVRDFFRAALEP
jgi:AcrR family transcriptional regulator